MTLSPRVLRPWQMAGSYPPYLPRERPQQGNMCILPASAVREICVRANQMPDMAFWALARLRGHWAHISLFPRYTKLVSTIKLLLSGDKSVVTLGVGNTRVIVPSVQKFPSGLRPRDIFDTSGTISRVFPPPRVITTTWQPPSQC
jgi:hypothetical protein